jgi:mannose-6-phosphate isomerase-like protein (cupin superfamily)
MHVTPSDLRVGPRRDLTLRSVQLGPVTAVVAELPAGGSAGTTLEKACDRAHWAVVMRGELELLRGGERWELGAGQAFYVPAGKPAHRFRASRRALIAGFVPLSGERARARDEVRIAARHDPRGPAHGEINAEAVPAGPWVMTRSSFGATSGYSAGWCDVPHWGIVVSGGGVIEYEDDVEVIAAGDLYYCPPGPPGHKLEVADGGAFVDFTPREVLTSTSRVGEWRPTLALIEAAR